MINNLNQKIKNHFNDLYANATGAAEEAAESFMKNLSLQDIPIADQVLIIFSELCTINQAINDFERKEYVHLADYEVAVYKIFSSRLLFDKVNEGQFITEGFLLNAKQKLLNQSFVNVQKQLPFFSFQDFLENKENVLFYQLHQRPSPLPEEEYYRMRNWQTQKMIACVDAESQILKHNFIGSQQLVDDLETSVRNEQNTIKHLFKNADSITPDQFIKEIRSLHAITDNIKFGNPNKFYELFCRFISGDVPLEILNPSFFLKQSSNIEIGELSLPPISCWSLIKYDTWLDQVLSSHALPMVVKSLDMDKEFNNTFNLGVDKVEQEIDHFQQNHPSGIYTVKEYEELIYQKLDQLRAEFKTLKVPDYYHLLLEHDTLKSIFLNNCLLDTDMEFHTANLQKAIRLNNWIDYCLETLEKIQTDPVHSSPKEKELELTLQIIDLITSMVPSSELIEKVLETLSNTVQPLRHGRKPIYFIIEDLKDDLSELYNSASAELKQLFEANSTDVNVQFASCQYRDLEYKQQTAKRQRRKLHSYFDDLKDLFKIELNYLDTINKQTSPNIDDLLHEQSAGNIKALSFGFKSDDTTELSSIIQALCVSIDFLDNRTTVKEFVAIVTAPDLTQVKQKIYLGCATNEFKLTLQYLKRYFKSIKPSSIDKSQLFFSKYNCLITKGNLYNAKTEKLLTKAKIDRIFNQKQ